MASSSWTSALLLAVLTGVSAVLTGVSDRALSRIFSGAMGDSAPATPPWRKPRPSSRRQSVTSSSAAEEAGPVVEWTVTDPDTEPPSPCKEACVGAVALSAASSGSLEPHRFLPHWKTRQSCLMKAQSKQRPKPQQTSEDGACRPGGGRSGARALVAGPTLVVGTRSTTHCGGRSSEKGSLGMSFANGTPCARTAIGRRRPGRKVSWRRGKRRRFETTQRFMWTYTWKPAIEMTRNRTFLSCDHWPTPAELRSLHIHGASQLHPRAK